MGKCVQGFSFKLISLFLLVIGGVISDVTNHEEHWLASVPVQFRNCYLVCLFFVVFAILEDKVSR